MKKIYLLVLSVSLLATTSLAQQASKITQGSKNGYQEWVEFSGKQAPAFNNRVVLTDEKGNISYSSSLRQISMEKDPLGYQHFRLQQMINNIPVENAIYVSHVKNGKLLAQNGAWAKNYASNLVKRAALSEPVALNRALQFIGARSYKWQDAAEEAFIKAESNNPAATFYPKASLVYYSGETAVDGAALRLAYKFDIYAAEPVSRKIVYVDAVNGAILGSKDLIHETNAPGTAVTAYSGSQSITTDSYNGSYRLRETGRGNGIQTYNLQKKTTYSRAVDFTDADNYWNNVNTNKDQYATDAHWGAEKTYDFYWSNFSRNSIDGNGFAIKSYVHYSNNYFNAFWDGSRMTYGDGSATDNYKPLTAIDVCGHEITHGLTSFTANLNYSNESGAMNEGFSDIFGTAIEWYARPTNHDWLIGGDFYVIRDMSNPNAYSDPDTYKGQYWYSGTSDNGGVHTNSGVLNFWFYLLTAGGNGTNDNGFNYSVSGLGMTKSQAIAYRTLTVYLVSTSTYSSARTASIKAAEDLYGVGSNEAIQTKNAWDAVGVGGGLSPAGRVAVAAETSVASFVPAGNAAVYPNPVNSQMQLQFNSDRNSAVTVDMIDMYGRVLMRKNISAVKGYNSVTVDVPSSVPVGNYMVRMNGQKFAAVLKQ